MTASGRPLASVIVPVYRNQPYLEAAIKSILALDYEPLEIVIRDDASPDDAYEVLRRLVDAYDGPHRVVLGRNGTNLSMANFNKLMEEASARYVIAAHDDDVQRPDRVSRIMEVYAARGVSMVTSNALDIRADGGEIGLAHKERGSRPVSLDELARHGWQSTLHGPALSWDRAVFERFGPVDIDGTARTSDWILPFRAALLDGIHFLDEVLLDRRVHADSRGHIGRAGADKQVNQVEIASEAITQTAYMLRTLDAFREANPARADELARIREMLMRQLEELAGALGTNRNRLHMRKLRATWIGHEAGALTPEEQALADQRNRRLSRRDRTVLRRLRNAVMPPEGRR